MKSILLIFIVTTFCTLQMQAANSFPEVGRSYQVVYAFKPDAGAFNLRTVKVLKKGSGGWVLVEGKVAPAGAVFSFWLNFDQLLEATEIEEAEQAADGDAE